MTDKRNENPSKMLEKRIMTVDELLQQGVNQLKEKNNRLEEKVECLLSRIRYRKWVKWNLFD